MSDKSESDRDDAWLREVEQLNIEADHFDAESARSHYVAAMANWSKALRQRDEALAALATAIVALEKARAWGASPAGKHDGSCPVRQSDLGLPHAPCACPIPAIDAALTAIRESTGRSKP